MKSQLLAALIALLMPSLVLGGDQSETSQELAYVQELRQLAKLRDEAVITEDEFLEKKRQLLGFSDTAISMPARLIWHQDDGRYNAVIKLAQGANSQRRAAMPETPSETDTFFTTEEYKGFFSDDLPPAFSHGLQCLKGRMEVTGHNGEKRVFHVIDGILDWPIDLPVGLLQRNPLMRTHHEGARQGNCDFAVVNTGSSPRLQLLHVRDIVFIEFVGIDLIRPSARIGVYVRMRITLRDGSTVEASRRGDCLGFGFESDADKVAYFSLFDIHRMSIKNESP